MKGFADSPMRMCAGYSKECRGSSGVIILTSASHDPHQALNGPPGRRMIQTPWVSTMILVLLFNILPLLPLPSILSDNPPTAAPGSESLLSICHRRR